MIREKALKVVLVIVGLLFLALVYPLLTLRGEEALQMMLSVYVTLGFFLLLASRNPSAYRSLIAFAAWSSVVHAAVMAVQSLDLWARSPRESLSGLSASKPPRAQQDQKIYVPAPIYFVLCSAGLLSAAGDLRMRWRGGLYGRQRILRHLWRMCFAWFIASGSVFLARPHLFPAILRETYALVFLGVLPLLLMIFWWVHLRCSSIFKRKRPVPVAAS